VDLSINEGTLVVTGGPGDAMHNAIVIKKTPKGLSAAGAELMLMTRRYGTRNQDWTLEHQDYVRDGARVFDTYAIVLTGGRRRSVWFDITEWLSNIYKLESGL
jgi:hypothetical protein